MNPSVQQKQGHRHREQACGYKGEGLEEGWGGRLDSQMQTIISRMDKQGPTA